MRREGAFSFVDFAFIHRAFAEIRSALRNAHSSARHTRKMSAQRAARSFVIAVTRNPISHRDAFRAALSSRQRFGLTWWDAGAIGKCGTIGVSSRVDQPRHLVPSRVRASALPEIVAIRPFFLLVVVVVVRVRAAFSRSWSSLSRDAYARVFADSRAERSRIN